MRPFLVSRNFEDAGGCTVSTATFASTSQLGAIFGSGTEFPLNVNREAVLPSRVIWFRNKAYALHDGAVWELNEATGIWSIVYQVPHYNRATIGGGHTGLYYFIDGDNIGKIGFFTSIAGASAGIQAYFDGNVWRQRKGHSTTLGFISVTSSERQEVYYNNQIIQAVEGNNTSTGYTSMDMTCGASKHITVDTAVLTAIQYPHTMAIHRNKMYAFSPVNASYAQFVMLERVGDRFGYRLLSGMSLENDAENGMIWKGFSTGDDSVYCIFPRPNPVNYQILRCRFNSDGSIISSGAIENVVVGAETPWPGNINAWWRTMWDFSNPFDPQFYLGWHGPEDSQVPITWLKWNGPNAAMTYAGTSVFKNDACPDGYINGGERHYVPGRINIQIEGYGPGRTADHCKFYYRVYPSYLVPENTSVSVFFMRPSGTDGSDIPREMCTLMHSSHGTITNNIINGIPLNSGTLYSVEWYGRPDGVVNGDFRNIMPVVSGAL